MQNWQVKGNMGQDSSREAGRFKGQKLKNHKRSSSYSLHSKLSKPFSLDQEERKAEASATRYLSLLEVCLALSDRWATGELS